MKRLLHARWIPVTVLLATSFTLMLTSSTDAVADDGIAADALTPGSWSVQFSVQPNFTLGSYSGSTLSLKRHLAGGKALRFGVSLKFGGSGEDFVDSSSDSFFTLRRSGIDDRSRQSIGVEAYYLWYTQRAAPVHGYWGIGPAVSWSRNRTDRNLTQSYIYVGQPEQIMTVVEDLTSRLWQVGIAGTAGVEWLVARRVGLFAEYGTGLDYSSTRATRRTTTTSPGQPTQISGSDSDRHGWDFSGSGGRLGVSVYY